MAPWWSFATDWPSVAANEKKDCVATVIGNLWSANFLAGKKRDEYNEPITAEIGWWESGGGGEKGEGLKGIVEEIFVGCGGDEILVDSQRVMMGRLEVSFTLFYQTLSAVFASFFSAPLFLFISSPSGYDSDFPSESRQ